MSECEIQCPLSLEWEKESDIPWTVPPTGLWSERATAILSHALENQPKGRKHIRQSLYQAEALTGDCLSQKADKAMYKGTEYLIRQRSPRNSLRWVITATWRRGTVLTIQNKR